MATKSLQLEYVPCELCGVDNTRHLFCGRDWQFHIEGAFCVVQCTNCGLIYTNPRPTQEAILRYYPEEYRGFSRVTRDEHASNKLRNMFKEFLIKVFPQGKKVVLSSVRATRPELEVALEKPGRVLDVGCGEGRTLYRLKQLGWQPYGVELDHKAVDYATATFSLDVFCGQLEEAHFPTGYFDLVIFNHSLEHLPHPLRTLRETYRILGKGGQVIIEAPNVRSIQARLFGERWVYWDVPRHLYSFSDVTLRRMLIEAGFQTTSFRHLPTTGGFAASLQYVWDGLTGKPHGRRVWNSRVIRIGLWPLAFMLATFHYTDCIRAEATKDFTHGESPPSLSHSDMSSEAYCHPGLL